LKPFDGPMLPAVERAIYERTGERIGRDAWDLRALPAHFAMTFRVVDEHDKLLATSRDLEELQRSLGQRARDLWARAPRAKYERSGMKTWEVDALPASVTLEVAGKQLLAYPALVETEVGVDVRLLESAGAAAAATREGLRRLLLFALSTTLGKLEAQLPGTLAPTTKRHIVVRALDEAFRLSDPDAVPRAKAAFVARLQEGQPALAPAMQALARIATELAGELEKVRAAMKPLASRPGATRTALDDLHAQLAQLIPVDLMGVTSVARLAHIGRYLRAMGVRLQRLSHDPQKDQQKAAQVTPFAVAYLQRRAKGSSNAELDEFGWLLEELRVQTFAPELKTAVPVSAQRMQEAWARVR
jgi:ATP-dependent helicase HrpA